MTLLQPKLKRSLRMGGMSVLIGASISCYAAGLPDTGQSLCYNGSNTTDCVADTSFPRQDGSMVSAVGYTKLDTAGSELDVSATSWACVRDNVSGLTWESKTADVGMRGVMHRYFWYDSNGGRNGGEPGYTGTTDSCGNSLGGLLCNTQNYSATVNASNYCGASDWRLPTQMELLSLVNSGGLNPSIDTAFFQNTSNTPYWSGSTYAMNPLNAWGVHFGYGAAHAEAKRAANAVRLVRGVWSK